MNEERWFTCKEFNARTAANLRKHEQEVKDFICYCRRHTAAIRRKRMTTALDLTLIAVTLLGIGVLIGCIF